MDYIAALREAITAHDNHAFIAAYIAARREADQDDARAHLDQYVTAHIDDMRTQYTGHGARECRITCLNPNTMYTICTDSRQEISTTHRIHRYDTPFGYVIRGTRYIVEDMRTTLHTTTTMYSTDPLDSDHKLVHATRIPDYIGQLDPYLVKDEDLFAKRNLLTPLISLHKQKELFTEYP